MTEHQQWAYEAGYRDALLYGFLEPQSTFMTQEWAEYYKKGMDAYIASKAESAKRHRRYRRAY